MVDGSSIRPVISHWLWPYELDRLLEVCEDYEAVGKADGRLTENTGGGRYGGVGISWRRDIGATPISSDCINLCGIRFTMDDAGGSVLSVVGVHLPSLDQGIDSYREHLVELEWIISESELLGPVVVAGDLNAHLGDLEEVNVKGFLYMR